METVESKHKQMPHFCGAAHSIPLSPKSDEWALKHVSVFTRHGDRMRCGYKPCWENDTASYDCDLYRLHSVLGAKSDDGHVFMKKYINGRNVLPGRCRLGQLTPTGYAQMKENGRQYRKSYKEFLPAVYTGSEEMFALRSDESSRTVLSGQAFFDGLYPVKTSMGSSALEFLKNGFSSKASNNLVEWSVVEKIKDNMFPNFHVCPRLNRAVRDAKRTERFHTWNTTVHEPLMKKVAKLLGKQPKEIKLAHLIDCLQTHICHQQGVPKFLQDASLLKEMQNAELEHYDIVAELSRRFASGPLVKEVLANLEAVVAGESSVKMALFSGHDTGPILPLLHAFRVTDGVWPPYASTIAIEVHKSKKNQDFAVRFLYNGKPLHIPGCDGLLCPFDQFRAVARKVIPRADECVETQKNLAGKLVHWAGMMQMSGLQGIFGNDVPVSDAEIGF